jgi:hypothetical protein
MTNDILCTKKTITLLSSLNIWQTDNKRRNIYRMKNKNSINWCNGTIYWWWELWFALIFCQTIVILHLVSIDSSDLEERPTSFYKINKITLIISIINIKSKNMLTDRRARKEINVYSKYDTKNKKRIDIIFFWSF